MAAYYYLTFPSIYFALRAEALLKDIDLAFKMVPVPRSISSSCGVALRLNCGDLPQAAEILAQNRVETDGAFRIEEKDFILPGLLKKEGPAYEK
ncbi:MAG: DUF3343 domain-containing protein [Dethiobacter sp.]|jgi:hypothetical protein|nr:DUF3343 domain-containing protein [Dethiobacter sp.]